MDMAIMMGVIQRFVQMERTRYSASLVSESSGYGSNNPENGTDPTEEDDEDEEEVEDEEIPNEYQTMYPNPNMNQNSGIPDAVYNDARDLAQDAIGDLITVVRAAIDDEFENEGFQ